MVLFLKNFNRFGNSWERQHCGLDSGGGLEGQETLRENWNRHSITVDVPGG
jgi:hypothetical protein